MVGIFHVFDYFVCWIYVIIFYFLWFIQPLFENDVYNWFQLAFHFLIQRMDDISFLLIFFRFAISEFYRKYGSTQKTCLYLPFAFLLVILSKPDMQSLSREGILIIS